MIGICAGQEMGRSSGRMPSGIPNAFNVDVTDYQNALYDGCNTNNAGDPCDSFVSPVSDLLQNRNLTTPGHQFVCSVKYTINADGPGSDCQLYFRGPTGAAIWDEVTPADHGVTPRCMANAKMSLFGTPVGGGGHAYIRVSKVVTAVNAVDCRAGAVKRSTDVPNFPASGPIPPPDDGRPPPIAR